MKAVNFKINDRLNYFKNDDLSLSETRETIKEIILSSIIKMIEEKIENKYSKEFLSNSDKLQAYELGLREILEEMK